jgi:hypothetical protein
VPEREGVSSLPYYDDPEALELARKASEQMGDFEFMTEMQNRLPPESRFGGKYGLISGMGYSGDYPQTDEHARIGSFGMPPKYDREAGISTTLTRGNRTALGFYHPEDKTQAAIDEEFGTSSGDFYLTKPEPGSVHYYGDEDVVGGLLEKRGYPKELAPVKTADIVFHELLHRGAIDVLPLEDLEEYAEEKAEESWGRDEKWKYRDAARTFNTMRTQIGQHNYTDVLSKFNLHRGDYEKLDIVDKRTLLELKEANLVLREFLTPERQEEYGLRLSSPAAEPKEKGIGSLFQDLFD